MVKETCASTIFNSILKGNLKVLGNKKNCANLHRRLCQKNDTNFLPYRILAISTYQHYVTCSIFDGMRSCAKLWFWMLCFENEFSTGKNQQKWWHMQQDLQTLRSMRCGGSCVSKCHGRSWPHTALCHADLGECWHVKTASIPSRKASFSCLCLTNVTSLAFLVQGHFEKQLVSDFARKNEMSGTFEKNQRKLRWFLWNISSVLLSWSRSASTIFNSILKGNLKVLENNTKLRECA